MIPQNKDEEIEEDDSDKNNSSSQEEDNQREENKSDNMNAGFKNIYINNDKKPINGN